MGRTTEDKEQSRYSKGTKIGRSNLGVFMQGKKRKRRVKRLFLISRSQLVRNEVNAIKRVTPHPGASPAKKRF